MKRQITLKEKQVDNDTNQVKIIDKKIEIEICKNFYDEQEWRYIPDINQIHKLNESIKYKIDPIIANPNLLEWVEGSAESFLETQSKMLLKEENKDLWLFYDYEDIRYLIVPDSQARINLINYILDLPSSNFARRKQKIQKHILLSKILVLGEIRKDW